MSKRQKATQEPEIETPTQTLKDIEFPEIPRRLLLCFQDDFIVKYFPPFVLKRAFVQGDIESSTAPVLPHCPLLIEKTTTASHFVLLILLPSAQLCAKAEHSESEAC